MPSRAKPDQQMKRVNQRESRKNKPEDIILGAPGPHVAEARACLRNKLRKSSFCLS